MSARPHGLWTGFGLLGLELLDFGSEHANDTASCDRNLVEFVKTLESTRYRADSPVSTLLLCHFENKSTEA